MPISTIQVALHQVKDWEAKMNAASKRFVSACEQLDRAVEDLNELAPNLDVRIVVSRGAVLPGSLLELTVREALHTSVVKEVASVVTELAESEINLEEANKAKAKLQEYQTLTGTTLATAGVHPALLPPGTVL